MRKTGAVSVTWMALAISAAAAVACNEHSSTGPGLRPTDPLRAGLPGAATLTASLGVAATNDVNTGSFGPVNGGLSIPARARFIVRVTGDLTVSPKPDLPCPVSSFPGAGTYGPRGYDQEMGIQVNRSSGVFVNLYYPGGNTTVLESDTLYTSIPTDLSFWRKGIIGSVGCAAGSSGLYAMSGSQTISVEVIEVVPPNGIVLEPDPAPRLYVGDSVVFTVRPKYTTTDEHLSLRSAAGLPYGWWFLPDSTASSPSPVQQFIPGCFTDWSCNFKGTTSGTIKVYGSFSSNSADPVDSAMVHVDVVTCPWKDDPIMDAPEVRQQLLSEFTKSAATQLERGGLIYRDDTTGRYTVYYSSGTMAPSQCRFALQLLGPQPGNTLVGIWHTHPIAANQVFTNCPAYSQGSRAAKGPSWPYDFDSQKVAGVPAYVIDPTDIFRIQNNPGRRWWESRTTQKSQPWKSCPNWGS